MTDVLVLNGIHLDKLGQREAQWYGQVTYSDLVTKLTQDAQGLDLSIECYQSNVESDFIEAVLKTPARSLLINAGAWTHTSLALRDALSIRQLPMVEVHLSNLAKRESIRHHSFLTSLALGVISGFGMDSYALGLIALKQHLMSEASTHGSS